MSRDLAERVAAVRRDLLTLRLRRARPPWSTLATLSAVVVGAWVGRSMDAPAASAGGLGALAAASLVPPCVAIAPRAEPTREVVDARFGAPEDEVEAFVTAQAVAHLAALKKHKGSLFGLPVDAWVRLLGQATQGRPSRPAPPGFGELVGAARRRMDSARGPRFLARWDPRLRAALPTDAPPTSWSVLEAARLCRRITQEVEVRAPLLAAEFALDAMGE